MGQIMAGILELSFLYVKRISTHHPSFVIFMNIKLQDPTGIPPTVKQLLLNSMLFIVYDSRNQKYRW